MKTITIYTRYTLSDVPFGVTHAKCYAEKPNISHNEDVGYELTITIPDGAKVTTNACGDALLDIPEETFYTPLFYNDVANRVEGGFHFTAPINGVSIVQKTEF